MTSERKPRVLLAAAHLTPGAGGIARVARLTARVLCDEGVAVSALSLLDEAPAPLGEAPSHTARGSHTSFLARHFAASWSHTHAVYDFCGIARAHVFARPGGLPFAVWMHGTDVWENLSRARLAALGAARLRLVNSQFTLDRFHTLHGAQLGAQLCWLGTESDDAPKRRADVSPNVLILGRMDPCQNYKGHAELIAAWPTVTAAVPGARLIIAGGGPGLGEVRDLAKASSAAAAIELIGHVPEAEIDALWARARVFAMPSRGEGFGLVYVEAMRHGVPVIASVHDAGAEVNADGASGLNVDLDRSGDLADKLIALLRDPAMCERLGAGGQARWREHFSYSAFRRRLAPLMHAFLSQNQ